VSVFERLGVTPVINAVGTNTRLSGGLMHPQVAAAMVEASLLCCDMLDLQAAACRVIRNVTRAEAGIVTSGASAGILLGAAACLAGLDPGRMNRLPEVEGRREIIVVRSQRNMYDRALVVAGAKLVEVGIPDRYSGPGVRDAEAWEIEDAIGPETAAIYYLAHPRSLPPLQAITEVARQRGVPVLVDAAAQLPPAGNLRAFIAAGADLVAFSGGKAIGGPQASGILCGRVDLVSSALVQMLDLDMHAESWRPPAEFAPLAQLRGLPHHGIGRSCKVGKEEIAGLVTALQLFFEDKDAERRVRWTILLKEIEEAAAPLFASRIVNDGPVPMLRWMTGRAAEIATALREGSPPIHCAVVGHELQFSPVALTPQDAVVIGRRLKALAKPG
jgi:D-glucosaminate-6-phosphate ammonia-lyase